MKIKTVLAAAGLALGATAGSALADYTYPTFNLSGDRAQTNAWGSLDLSTVGTPTAGLYTGAEIFLDWSSTGNSATNNDNAWSSEARSAFASAGGTGTGTNPTYPGGTTNYTATVGTPTNGASNANNVLNLRFNQTFGQTYNAANPLFWNIRQAFTGFTGQDVTWANIRITLKSFVPPTPPTAIDLGTIGGNNTMAMGTAAYNSISPVQWFKFTLAQSIPAAQVGKWLSIDTLGTNISGGTIIPNDTEIALYDSNGFRIGNNDDHGPGTIRESVLTYGDLPSSDFAGVTGTGVDNGALAAGVYYIAVSPFDLAAGAGGFTATHSPITGVQGSYKVTVKIPAPGSMALLGLGGLLAARRRRA